MQLKSVTMSQTLRDISFNHMTYMSIAKLAATMIAVTEN